MWKEFRAFAMKGNVVELAVAVIIGTAFGKIVDSLVNDIFMPIVGAVTGGLDFTNYFILLRSLTEGVAAPATYDKARELGATIGYGKFLTVSINFIIIAWILFIVVKAVNRVSARDSAESAAKPPPAPSRQEVLLEEIRDLLKSK
ncbi:large conductance mechanosensitive channel protein MscL [Prosthecodimorpha staleyi]|uniref:Large-conductance mechanosensitive channel n=1 Tax=Prosthecodimorpha staleyi TaxID=2840188 RepID=A0A947DAZ6_9HYPH|nr:large conductance mechanosensitive channel protein MscL [Prosthecodimorpha staleyi]MBT9292012.1 large conductance mechanosensitive channel protein MscL [Prosthecodimorpha staleyi]